MKGVGCLIFMVLIGMSFAGNKPRLSASCHLCRIVGGFLVYDAYDDLGRYWNYLSHWQCYLQFPPAQAPGCIVRNAAYLQRMVDAISPLLCRNNDSLTACLKTEFCPYSPDIDTDLIPAETRCSICRMWLDAIVAIQDWTQMVLQELLDHVLYPLCYNSWEPYYCVALVDEYVGLMWNILYNTESIEGVCELLSLCSFYDSNAPPQTLN